MTEDTHEIQVKHRSSRRAILAAQCLAALSFVAVLWVLYACLGGTALLAPAAAATGAAGLAAAWFVRKLLRWNVRLWIGPYLRQERFRVNPAEPLDLCIVFADHFEPNHGRSDGQRQLQRVRSWEAAYQEAIRGHVDSDGRCPQHTWFFPGIDPADEAAAVLATWPGRGWGEIEYHLHHDENPGITRAELRERIEVDIRRLKQLGAVSIGRYGLVHGMYALAAGDSRYCRAVEELDVLMETGCYADFTFPDIQTPAQPAQVNSIYYALTSGQPKPYDRGLESAVGMRRQGLLMIPGPMYAGLFPRMLDDGNIDAACLPHAGRINRWLDAHVHVKGRPNWVFIVMHSHTALEHVQQVLFQGAVRRFWADLERRFKRPNARLHYLTAREAYNVIKAAEGACGGDPNDYRDYEIPRPANRAAPEVTGAKDSVGR